jgi:hypothetical protein
MDTPALVEKDFRIGNDVIGLLTAAGFSIVEAFWAYMPEIEEWRLMLTSPKVKQMGIRNSYMLLSKILHTSPLLDEIPLRRVSLVSPDDRLIERLKRRVSYFYEGTLHIVRSSSSDNRAHTYMITFAPYTAPGGSVPMVSLDGDAALQHFLLNQIGVDAQEVATAMRELLQRGSFSLPNVTLSTSDLRRLRLLPSWPKGRK